MKIKVLPPYGSDRSALDERGWTEMPEGSSVKDVLHLIRCSRLKAKVLLISVTGERSCLDRTLQEGDVVGFFFPIAGG